MSLDGAQSALILSRNGNFGDPENLSVFSDFGASVVIRGSCGVERRGGGGAATFRWCGYDWRDSLYLG